MITRGTHTYIKETISPFILPYKVGITSSEMYTMQRRIPRGFLFSDTMNKVCCLLLLLCYFPFEQTKQVHPIIIKVEI
jgi:hypothetical protein